ncbi:hypothetical protein ABES58_31965, partial [Paenibacillus lautus]|uniref:hypothetical protein n=1 Tax=Paenibacillus lautus TaxID=1401 RepID=UPI003D2956F5
LALPVLGVPSLDEPWLELSDPHAASIDVISNRMVSSSTPFRFPSIVITPSASNVSAYFICAYVKDYQLTEFNVIRKYSKNIQNSSRGCSKSPLLITK